jgi:D-alanyl-D-alanine carboxypeptidase
MRRLLLGTVLLFVAFQSVNAQSFNSNLSEKLQFRLDSLYEAFPYSIGISASVYCPGQGIWTGVSGNSHVGQPLTTDMAFGIASNTKLFVAVTMLRLAEDNILSLDDPLSDWIPTYTNVNPSISIRQLLNHTSGVSDPLFLTGLLDTIEKYPTRVFTPEEVLTWVGSPLFNPGAGYGYSNINYLLAGMVAESATGKHISQLIRENILSPLQMNSTFYDIEEPEVGILAHRWHDGVDFHDTSRVSLNSAGGAAGSLFSTSREMAQWYRALMSNQLLTENSFAELTSFAYPGNYGLGLLRSTFFENETWGHGGSTHGYKSRLIYDPCRQTVVCGLSNSDLSAVDGITAMLYNVLISYLPACPEAITGETSVFQGQNSVTYTLPAIVNATSYSWTLPQGANGNSSTNSITVNFEDFAVSGAIKVKGINSYGESAESSLAITVTRVLNDFLSITNLSLANSAVECFNATDTITIAGEGSIVDFQTGSLVTLIAGQSIRFLPGFNAHSGSWIDAHITTNGTFCNGTTGIEAEQPAQKSGSSLMNAEKISELLEERSVKIYPNPNNGNFNIEFLNLDHVAEIRIYNTLGKTIFRGIVNNLVQQQVNLGGIVKGLYMVKITDQKEQFIRKVVVN